METSVRLPARLERLVSRVAKERGSTKSEVIRSVLTVLEHEDRAAHARPTPYEAMKHLIGCSRSKNARPSFVIFPPSYRI